MSSVTKTAGAAGSITVTTKNTAGQLITPVSAPVVKWYTDSGRTLGELTLTTTGSGSSYSSSWTGVQAPASAATRYLKVTIEVSAGVFDVDVDDDLSFVDAVAVIGTTDYTTRARVKASLGIPDDDTTDDDAIDSAITAASRAIDRLTGTTFYGITEARVYPTRDNYSVWVDRYSAVSTVETGGNGSYSTTVTDVVSWPYNAVARGGAYRRVDAPGGVLVTSETRPTVRVTATWGYQSVPDEVEQAALIKAVRLFRRKDTPEGVAGSSDFGVMRLSKEDPDVVSLLSAYVDDGIG